MIDRRTLIGILIAVAASAMYGFYPATSRAVYADGGNVALVIATMMVFRTLGLLLYCGGARQPIFTRSINLPLTFWAALCQFTSVICISTAVYLMPGPLVIIIIYTYTFMIYLLSVIRGEEKLRASTLALILAALGGLTLVLNLFNADLRPSLLGIGVAFLGEVATMVRIYLFGHLVKTRHPAVTGAETFTISSALMLPLLIWFHPGLPASDTGLFWLIVTGITIGIANLGMFFGVKYLGSFRFSLFTNVEPIFTLLFSVLILGEGMSAIQGLGFVIVIASLTLYQLLQNRRAARL